MSNSSDGMGRARRPQVPELKPTKMCTICIADNDVMMMRRRTLLKEFKRHGITQAILDEFGDIVAESVGFTDEYVVTLIAFTATLAAGELQKPREEAEKVVVGMLKYEQSIRRRLKKSAVQVPQSECVFHQHALLHQMQEEVDVSPSEMEALDQAVQKQKGKDGTTPGSMYG